MDIVTLVGLSFLFSDSLLGKIVLQIFNQSLVLLLHKIVQNPVRDPQQSYWPAKALVVICKISCYSVFPKQWVAARSLEINYHLQGLQNVFVMKATWFLPKVWSFVL